MSLQSIYETLQAQGATVTLNDASLGTSGLDALLKADLLIDSIAVSLQGSLQPPASGKLQFAGTSTFLYGGGKGLVDCNPAQVNVTITVTGAHETPVLSVAIVLPNGWTLGSSFQPFLQSPFDSAVIASPSLVFGFNTSEAGLVFSSELNLVGPLIVLPYLFASPPAKLSLSGRVTLTADGPSFAFSCSLPDVKAPFGTVAVTAPVYKLSLSWEDAGDPGGKLPDILNAFTGVTSVVSAYPVPMTATLPLSGNILTLAFGGDAAAKPLAGTDQLQNLFGSLKFTQSLTPSLFGVDMPFGLKAIGVQVNPKNFNVLSVWGTVGTTRVWYPISDIDQFSIMPLDISWNVVDPAGKATLYGIVDAGITIGSYTFDVAVTYPNFVIAGHLPGGVELDLTNINAKLFTQFPNNKVPMNPDLGASTVTFGEFAVMIVTPTGGQKASFQLTCQAAANIQLGAIDLALQSASLDLTLRFPGGGKIDPEFKVDGIFSVNQWQFSLAADIQSSGLQLRGSLLQPQTIQVGQALHNLVGGSVTGPSGWDMAVTIQSFALDVDTAQALLDVNGKLDWKLTVLGTTFDPNFLLHITSKGRGADRQWSGALAGSLAVGGMSFGVGYQFGPAVSILSGAWSSGSYDWTKVMSSFGQSQPDMPASVPAGQQPNLAPSVSLVVSYDFKKKVLTILGKAAAGGGTFDGFFIAVQGNGFAAGIGFELPPGFFGQLNHDLAMFDSFGLSKLALAIANFDNPYQNLPVGSGLTGVASGINFYAKFATDQADATTKDAMTALTGGQQTVQVWIAFTKQSTGWKFRFKGALEHARLDLGEAVTLTGASLALTAGSGATGFNFSVVFDLTLTIKPGSGTIIVSGGTSDVLTFIGEIGFAGSQESFGGFMAAFLVGTWLNPFDLKGLEVSNLGLLLGVGVVAGAPVPSFGMTGFLVYATPHVDFEFYLVIYLNGANPQQSIFIGSINKATAVELLDMLLWCAAGVEVPSLLQNALSSYSIEPIPIDVSKQQTLLTADDLAQLNAYNVSDNVRKLFEAIGHPLSAEQPGAPYRTLIVALKDSEHSTSNTTWFIADFNVGRVYRLAASGLTAPFSFTLAMNPWLYVVPTDTSIGPFSYKQGFGFGGELQMVQITLDVIAQVATTKGLSIDASAPKPFAWPVSPIPDVKLPQLLVFSDPKDAAKGPSLSLSTYQQGDVPPHFYLAAKVSLLKLADFETQVKILASGFSFEASLSALDILNASLSCTIDDTGFAASGSFTLDLTVDTDPVKIEGVTVIPGIHLSTGFAISLGISFPTSSSDTNQSAGFSGSISFHFQDQSFSASFSFTLADLNSLVSTIEDWIVHHIGELLKSLLDDVVQWAKALANGLFELTTELAAEALRALGATIDEIASLLADVGRSIDEIYNALVHTLGVAPKEAIYALTKAFRFDIVYAALGQHIGPAAGATTPAAIVDWMQGTAAPDFAAGRWDGLALPGAGLLSAFKANLFEGEIGIETAMYDPGLYELHLTGFGYDLMLPYAKVSDSLGVFQIKIPNGPTTGFGPFGFRTPAIDISVWTDGGFLIDRGYPDNGDWTRAGAVSLPVAGIAAQGGFRLQRLSPNISLPAAWSDVSIAVQIDAALRLSLSGGIDIGILSGGYWMSYGGGFTGIAGYGSGISPSSSGQFDPSQPAEFAGSLWAGFSAGIYGSVDFGLISASVHLSLSGALGVGLAPGGSVLLSVRAHVSVGASISIHLLIVTITISFHFDVTLTIGPPSLPWSSATLLLAAEMDRETVEPIRFARRGERLLAAVPVQAAPLAILFLPELTNAYEGQGQGSLKVELGLGVPYQKATPSCDFNALCRALLSWTGQLSGQQPSDENGLAAAPALHALAKRLAAKPRLSRLYRGIAGADDAETQLDYASLVAFLSQYFAITVRAATASDSSAVTFPIVPDLSASAAVGGKTPLLVDFSTYNSQPPAYEDAIEDTFARFKVFGTAQGDAVRLSAPADAQASLATYVFVAYFEYLLQGAVNEAAQQHGVPFNQLVFDNTAAGLTTSFRGGLQLPESTAPNASTQPMLALTGQQQDVAAFSPGLASFSLSLGQTKTWFTLDSTQTSFDNTKLKAFQSVALNAPLTLLNPGPLVSVPSTFMLGAFTPLASASNAAWTLVPLPENLLDAIPAQGLALMLGAGSPEAPVPLTLGFAWSTRIDLTLAQVPDGAGGYSATVYQLNGIDADKLSALAALLAGLRDQPVSLALMYNSGAGLQLATTPPEQITLLRTNLSIAIQPPPLLARPRTLAAAGPVTSGTMMDAADFLGILDAYGRTNATGYYFAFAQAEQGIGKLFTTGTKATITLLIQRTKSGSAASTMALMSDDALIFQGTTDSKTAYFAQAATLPSYQPANAPGTVRLNVARPNPEVVDSKGSDQQTVDSLYNLFTASVQGNAFAPLGYAPAASPATDPTDAKQWGYTLALPLNRLLASGADASPYAAIGTTPTISFQLRDCFGNAVANKLPDFSPPQLYTDPLIGPSSWLGTEMLWKPGGTESLSITLAPNADALQNNAEAAKPIYRQAIWQMSRSGDIAFFADCALNSAGPVQLLDATVAQILAYAKAVQAYLNDPKTAPLPQPVTFTLSIGSPVGALPPVAISVSITERRVRNVDDAAAALLPTIASSTAGVSPDLAAGLAAFAASFEVAFAAYKLGTASGARNAVELWAVGVALTKPALGSRRAPPTYFAPAPLYTSMQSGSVAVPDFGDFSQGAKWPTNSFAYSSVDCDQLQDQTFGVIDRLLAGPFAAAAFECAPDAYDALVRARSALATTYSQNQLTWLFAQQNGQASDPTLYAARKRYAEALQLSLANAYAIDAVLAIPADWNGLPPSAQDTLALYGSVAPTAASASAGIPPVPTLLAVDGGGKSGTLFYAFRPGTLTADVMTKVELAYAITHVALTPVGVAPTWITLAIPPTASIASVDAGGTEIPIVNRFFPATPTLGRQSAQPYTGSGGGSAFEDLLKWTYGAGVVLQPVAQDTASLTVSYNVFEAHRRTQALATAPLKLDQALVQFQQAFAQIEPNLDVVIARGSKAGNILAALTTVLSALTGAIWPAPVAVKVARLSASSPADSMLSLTLAQDTGDPNAWLLTVSGGASGLPGALSAVPLTASGAAQPDTELVSQAPDYVVRYRPADVSAPVLVNITLAGLDVRLVQSARAKVQVSRNAHLIDGLTTNSDFVFRTPTVAFPTPIVPSLEGPSEGLNIAGIVTRPQSGALNAWLEALLAATFGPAPNPHAQLQLGYNFPAFTGTREGVAAAATALSPRILSRTISIDNGHGGDANPSQVAEALATPYLAWADANPLRKADGALTADLTLYSDIDGGSAALLHLPNLWLALKSVADLP